MNLIGSDSKDVYNVTKRGKSVEMSTTCILVAGSMKQIFDGESQKCRRMFKL